MNPRPKIKRTLGLLRVIEMTDEVCDNLTVNKTSKMLGNVNISGNLGIGIDDPKFELDVNAKGIKLGLQKNGGGQLVITNTPNDNKICLEASNSVGTDSTPEMVLTGFNGKNVPLLTINADNTKFHGDVNIGGDVDIQAKIINLGLEKNGGGILCIGNNPNDNKIYLEAHNSTHTANANEMLLTGLNGNNVPVLTMNADTTNFHGNVDVQAKVINLGLQNNGGGILNICNNPNDKKIWLEAHNSTHTASANELLFTGLNGTNVPILTMNADTTNFHGNVDVQAKVINLGLQNNGGGILNICNNPNDKKIWLEAHNSTHTASANELLFTGLNGTNVPVLTMNANTTNFNGNINAHDVILVGGDCAEDFDIIEAESIEPGTVMVIDDNGALRASEQAYDKRVAGVISGGGNLRPGITLDKHSNDTNRLPIALTGKVYCKVDAEYNSIEVGDLLTSSSTKGHAMKVNEHVRSIGAIIGKALKALGSGKGLIPILVALQ